MKDYILAELEKKYQVNKIEIPNNSKIDKKGMHFLIEDYEIENIGKLSIITMKAMLGAMKMDTIVLSPLYKDMPLFSYDYIQAMGNDTLLVELYDMQVNGTFDTSDFDTIKSRYTQLPDHDLGAHWYDDIKLKCSISKKGKKLENDFYRLSREYVNCYLNKLETAENCEKEQKQEKIQSYVDGLFAIGGPSTDQFKKLIGDAAAKELFEKYVFNCK